MSGTTVCSYTVTSRNWWMWRVVVMSGTTVCSYTVTAAYPGKEAMVVFSQHMRIPRRDTMAATEQAALAEAPNVIAAFWRTHFPDDVPPPVVSAVMLGSMTFVPDDYEWRRT